MADRHTFPPKIFDFNAYLLIAIPWLISEAVRLKIPAQMITDLTDLFDNPVPGTGWKQLHAKADDPTLGTPQIVRDRQTRRTEIEDKMREIFGEIPQSVYNSTDREKLNRPLRDAEQTRAIVMDHAPDIDKVDIDHLKHTLRFQDPATPDSTAMPLNQKIILEWAVADAGVAEADVKWDNSKNVTSAFTSVTFQAGQVTKTAYYRCCYENTHGERSIFSDMITTVVA